LQGLNRFLTVNKSKLVVGWYSSVWRSATPPKLRFGKVPIRDTRRHLNREKKELK